MLFGIFVVLFVIVCLILVFLVIIQSDKGGGLSGAIGGGLSGANTLLGTQDTANILTRGTTVFAMTYMALCILLSLVLSRSSRDVQQSQLRERAEMRQEYSPASALEGGSGLPMAEEPEGEEAEEGQPLPQGFEAPTEGEGETGTQGQNEQTEE